MYSAAFLHGIGGGVDKKLMKGFNKDKDKDKKIKLRKDEAIALAKVLDEGMPVEQRKRDFLAKIYLKLTA